MLIAMSSVGIEFKKSGFETQARYHKKSKTLVSVTPQNGLMFSKIAFKKILDIQEEAHLCGELKGIQFC